MRASVVRLLGAVSGIEAARFACCATAVVAGAGCSGEALVVGEELPGPIVIDEEPGGSGVIDAPEPPDVAILEDCPATPAERQELLGCWPTPHLGAWRGFFLGVPRYETLAGAIAEFPTGDVLLQLGVDGAGRLTFGLDPAISSAALAIVSSCEQPAAPAGCERPGFLIPGFSYALEQMALYDPELEAEPRIAGEPLVERPERMQFRVPIGEPWNAWCTERPSVGDANESACLGGDCEKGKWPAPPPPGDSAGASGSIECRCDEQGCRPDLPSLFIELAMSDSEEWLRGTYTPGGSRLGQARLELRKETDL